jgi:hypothetical protein
MADPIQGMAIHDSSNGDLRIKEWRFTRNGGAASD